MNNIALFDMDNSLANYTKALVRDLSSLRSPGEPDVTIDNIWDDLPWLKSRIDLVRRQPGWWFELEPIQEGFDILEWCQRFGFHVNILTKGPKRFSRAWREKVEWCQKYIGNDVDVHITSDKGLVYGKVLYDDYPEYMLRWLKYRPRGLGIMPVTSYNHGFSHPNVVMYNGLADTERVFKALQVALNRKPGQDLELDRGS